MGSTSDAAQEVHGNRVRLRGYSIVSGGSAGLVQFFDGTPEDGTEIFSARTIGTDNQTIDNTIPDEGILFPNGLSVVYTVGTIDRMNIFFS